MKKGRERRMRWVGERMGGWMDEEGLMERREKLKMGCVGEW